MKSKQLWSACLSLALLALLGASALAQVGRLEGSVVKADTKEPVVGAEVQIERTDIKGSYPVKTDKKGTFLHAGVPLTGTYTVIVSAPGHQPQFFAGIRGSNSEPIKVELQPGDGRKLSLADIKAMGGGGAAGQAAKPGQKAPSAEELKKQQEEYNKAKEARDKQMADHEGMKKLFEEGQQLYANKDWGGAITKYNEAAKLDPDQQAIWGNLAIALYNRGVTNVNESLKDPTKRDPAKQDFTDAISASDKALALVEPQMADPAKGPAAKKGKLQYLKIKADSESLLAKRLGMAEMADAANKDYVAAAALAETPAEKQSFAVKGAETLREAGKGAEATAALKAILEADPENVDALYSLGLVYANEEKTWQDSANALQKFVDRAPDTDPRKAEAKTVIAALLQGNKNLVVPKSEPAGRRPAPAKKKP